MEKRFERKITLLVIVSVCYLGIFICCFYRNTEESYNFTQTSTLITDNSKQYKIKIKSMKDETKITFHSENLCSKGISEKGFVQETDWIVLDKSQEYLCMYGGFNFSKWVFVDENGNSITKKCDDIHNDFIDTTLDNKSICVMEIPDESIAVKVYYSKDYNRILSYLLDLLKKTIKLQFEDCIQEIKCLKKYYQDINDSELYIVYGQVPVGAIKNCKKELVISDINKEIELIYDREDGWSYKTESGYEKQDFDERLFAGKSISYDQSVQIEIVSNGTITSDGIYGIKSSLTKDEMVVTRVGGLEGLHTNFCNGNTMLSPYNNDFDSLYPWSEIKECFVDDAGNVYYDKKECSKDIIYNEMVEIPVFYSKREVIDGYEYIFISDKCHEGFEIEPTFITDDGICDKIYISKYLSSILEDNMGSYSSNTPMIDVSLKEINEYMNKKGSEWTELDFLTLNMLQRLWLVETAVKNSQSIFEGYTESSFIYSTDNDPKYAQKDNGKCNYIDVRKTDYTNRYNVGETVTVFTFEKVDQYSAYLYFNENYQNDNKLWQRKIEKIEDGTLYRRIYFSGEPINIKKGESIIANLPQECGVTDSILYHTGSIEGTYGKRSFKYRGMENLWGNVCVVLEGLYAEDGKLFVEYPDINRKSFEMTIPKQNKGGGVAKSFECAVKIMVFDENNEMIMFPIEIGDGATLTNNYGDWLAVPEKDFYVDTTKRQYITYGMTWDLANYAGLFAYRVQPSYSSKRVENGGRIMMRSYR